MEGLVHPGNENSRFLEHPCPRDLKPRFQKRCNRGNNKVSVVLDPRNVERRDNLHHSMGHAAFSACSSTRCPSLPSSNRRCFRFMLITLLLSNVVAVQASTIASLSNRNVRRLALMYSSRDFPSKFCLTGKVLGCLEPH